MTSVCLDIPDLPGVEYEGEYYDAMVICVDRHSGWIVARPTQRLGITGKKAAQLMINSSWGEMGVPSIITCDRGSQFVSGWWTTMCARLGIRRAFAQAHRSNTNGRAEVAVRMVQDTLRKLHTDCGINWVEALPRVLRIHHDAINPVLGYSPYQALFGRHRALAALPFEKPEEGQEANEFFSRMAEIDVLASEKYRLEHKKRAETANAYKTHRPPYKVGAWVWRLKPKPVGGVKTGTWWTGPCKVLARIGESTYRIQYRTEKPVEVHAQHLKPYVCDMPSGPPERLEVPPLLSAAEPEEEEIDETGESEE